MECSNVATVASLPLPPLYGKVSQVNYSTAKSALISMTKSLAKEGGRKNIFVNAIDTAMVPAVPKDIIGDLLIRHPIQRLGKVEEFAAPVAFGAIKECGYVSGRY